MWKDKKEQWTWLISLFVATIIVFVGRMSMPICEVEIAEEFGWDEERLGKVMSVFFWGYAITQIPGGAAADIFGGATTICFSLFVWGTICWATPMLVLTTREFLGNSMAYAVLFGLRILMGLAQAIHFPSLSSILSRKMNDSGRAFAMSFVCCGSQFGTLLTGYFGSKLLEVTNWKTVFVFSGILGVSFSVFMFYLNKNSYKNRHRVINLGNLEDAPLMGIKNMGGTKLQSKHDFKSVVTQISTAVVETFELSRQLMKNKSFLALVAVHMSNTNSIFILSFWLPKYFHDQFPDSGVPSSYYNVIPWIGVIPGAILYGLLSDLLSKKTNLSTTSLRRLIQTMTQIGGVVFSRMLANGGMDIQTTLFVTAVMVFCLQGHNAAAMVNPQDIAPQRAGAVFGVMNSCGAIMSSFGIWFSGWLLDNYNKNWSLVFNWIMIVNLFGGVVYFLFGSAKRLV